MRGLLSTLIPTIAFSGRASRQQFWTELLVSVYVVPLMIAGIMGLVALGPAAGVFSFAVFGLFIANFIALLGLVTRRIRDTGRHPFSTIVMSILPLLIIFAASVFRFAVPELSALVRAAYPFLTLAQLVLGYRLVAIVAFGESRAGVRKSVLAARGKGPPVFEPNRFETQTAHAPSAQWPHPNGLKTVGDVLGAFADKLSRDQGLQNARASIAKAVHQLSERSADAAKVMGQPSRERSAVRRYKKERPPKPKTRELAKRYASNVVRRTGAAPRTGRTNWMSGILRGPWG